MPKSLSISPKIETAIKRSAGADVDVGTLSVFECSAINTRPLQKGGFYNGARFARSVLDEMAGMLAAGKGVPLHTLHMQGFELPVGKVFDGGVFDSQDGESELRAQFYLESASPLISSLEAGIIDEVSIAFLTKHAYCSECSWDFFESLDRRENVYRGECENGHQIGQDGVHVRLVGLKTWSELSLVSRGGARDPKIVSRSAARLSADTDGLPLLYASTKDPETMNVAEFATALSAKATEIATLTRDLETARLDGPRVTELTGQLEAANAQIATLTEAAEKVPGLEAQVTDLQAQLAAAPKAGEPPAAVTTFLAEQCRKALIITGSKDAVPEKLEDQIALLGRCQLNLVNLFPADGRAVPSGAGNGSAGRPSSSSAYQRRT